MCRPFIFEKNDIPLECIAFFSLISEIVDFESALLCVYPIG